MEEQANDFFLRCEVTGNICGSDTWAIGAPCPCENCQQWLAALNAVPTPGERG